MTRQRRRSSQRRPHDDRGAGVESKASGMRQAGSLWASLDPRRSSWAAGVLILLAALAVYSNSFHGVFTLDDVSAITDNPTIRRLWPLTGVLLPPLDNSAVDRRPVVNLSVAINYALGGVEVWGYHLMNQAAHVAAAWTLFAVVRRTLRSPALRETYGPASHTLALVAAILWTVHPLQTNAVTHVIQRTEVLAGLFYLLTLYCVIRGTEAEWPRSWYLLAVFCCLLAMGSKEAAVSAPLVVLLYDRIFLANSWRELWQRRWGLYMGLAATWGLTVSMLARHWAVPSQGEGSALWSVSEWWDYASIQFQSITWYLRLVFWPSPLIMDYGPGESPGLLAMAPYAGFVLLLILGTAAALRWRPALGFLGVWFFAILAPSSGLVPIAPECAAEKRMYLPLAAVVMLVVTGAFAIARRWDLEHGRAARGLPSWARLGAYGIAACVVVLLIAVSARRNEDYRSDLAIWQDTVQKRPGNHRAHYNLGVVLFKSGDLVAATGQFQATLRVEPDHVQARNNLGVALLETHSYHEAAEHFKEVLRLKPDYANAHYNLGIALFKSEDLAAAAGQFQEVLRLKPDFVEAHNRLGFIALRAGEHRKAIAHFEEVLRQEPGRAEAHHNLGIALFESGNAAAAVGQFREALRLKPDFPQAQSNLGIALRRAGNR